MSTPRIELPKGQTWFIQRMQAAGYKSDLDGMCSGIAHMGMQAILAEDVASFDQRLKIISDLQLEDFKLLCEDRKSFEERLKIASDMQPKDVGKQTPNISRADIIAFFDGIELSQQAFLYPHLFEKNTALKAQDATFISSLALSVALDKTKEKKGGIIKACAFSGIYNKTELADYFSGFCKALEKDPNITHPFSFVLKSTNHTITIGYDPRHKKWFLINANRLPTKQIADANILAKRVISAFLSKKITAFSSEIYVVNEHYDDAVMNVLNIWQTQESWKKMHTVSSVKALSRDSWGGFWLDSAALIGDLEAVNALLQDPRTDPNQASSTGATPLHIAAQNGRLKVVNALLQETRIDPNQASSTGATPLSFAAQNGHLDVVNALLQRPRTDPNLALSSNGATPLYIATQNGHLDVVNALLRHPKTNPNQARTTGVTPLYIAAEHGHVDVVNALLQDKRTNPNPDCTTDGTTPLLIAAQIGHFDVVNALLQDKRTNPNQARTTDCATPLLIAVHNNRLDVVNALLQNTNTDPNQALSSNGVTPLYIAAQNGHLDVVNALLRHPRTNPNQARTTGVTPLHIAAQNGHLDVVNALLQDKRTNPNQARTNDGATPLLIAVHNNRLDVVNALLQDPRTNSNQACTNDGATPLYIAAQNGHFDVVQLLLNKQADITITFTINIESLRSLAKAKKVESEMETFINKKMKQSESSNISMTPLEIAEVMGHTNIVKLLKTPPSTFAVKTLGLFSSPSSPGEQDQSKPSLQKNNNLSSSFH